MYNDVRWRIQHNAILTRSRLNYTSDFISPTCVFVCSEIETPFHLFWDCQLSTKIWARYTPIWEAITTTNPTWSEYLDSTQLKIHPEFQGLRKQLDIIFTVISSCILHKIWFRNAIVFLKPERTINISKIHSDIDVIIGLHWCHIMRRCQRQHNSRLRNQYRKIRLVFNRVTNGLFNEILDTSF